MKFTVYFSRAFAAVWRALRTTPNLSKWTFILAMGIFAYCLYGNYHLSVLPKPVSDFTELPKNWTPPADAQVFDLTGFGLAYLRLFVMLGAAVYFVVVVRAAPDPKKMTAPTWIMSLLVTGWAVGDSLYERWAISRMESIGEEFSMTAYVLYLILMIGTFMSPPILLMYYQRCKIMERYVLLNFLQPLVFCLLGFFSLWVVMDLKDNIAQFQDNKIPKIQVFLFYIKLLPFIYVSVAPVTMLLATLYSLGRMSRSNEIISMLGAGKSMGQVLRPIFLMGIYASFLGMAANYEWAPVAEGNKKTLLQDVKDKMSSNIMSLGLVYRNNENLRTWFIGMVPYDLRKDTLRRVTVYEEDAEGHLVHKIDAQRALWSEPRHLWTFITGVDVYYKDGFIDFIRGFDHDGGKNRTEVEDWTETPWVLLSGSITPEFLSVPTLLSYVTANKTYAERKLAPFWTHFYYRFALPLQCLVIVLIAAPLGVVYSRRGLLGGVASSVFIFFILLFIDSMFLNMGKGNRMPAWLAPWIPHLILGTVGGVMFHFRANNRDFPKFTSPKSMLEALGFLLGSFFSMFRPSRRASS